jgi:hypothetical protein
MCKKLLSGEERVAERLVNSRFFDKKIGEHNTNGVDGLLAALETSTSSSTCTPQQMRKCQYFSDINHEEEATPTHASPILGTQAEESLRTRGQ